MVRLAWWTGGLLAGVALALLVEATPRAAAWAGVPATAAVLGLLRGRLAVAAEVLAALAIGGYAGARALEVPSLPAPVAVAVGGDGRTPATDVSVEQPPPVKIEGWVLSALEPTGEGMRQGSRLRVRATAIDSMPLDRAVTISLTVANGVPPLLPGDGVRFSARLRAIRGLANPGVSDGTLAARAAGVDVFGGVGAAAALESVPSAARAPPNLRLLRAAALARQALGAAIDRAVPGAAGVLLHTAVLGERRATDERVEDGFRAAGATHVLSVSGLHLAAITLVCYAGARWALARVPRLPLWLDVRATAAALAVPLVVFYTLLTGAAVATVRSAVMMLVALVGTVVGRRSVAVGAIAAAVLVLLAWSPLVAADVSFQLSVVSVLALTALASRLDPTAGRAPAAGAWWRRALRWLGQWLARMAAASVAAGLTTAPLVAHAFGEVAPAGALGNLVLVPLIELVVVPFGLAGALLGALGATMVSVPLLTLASWAARAALVIAELFRVHAPLLLTRSPGVFETAGLSLGFAGTLWSIRRDAGGRLVLPVAVVLLAAAVASMTASELHRRSRRELVVTFLDVGQGDAAVIQAPGGRTLVIDAGGTYDGSFDPGARVVEPFLRARGIVHVDLLALSHPHPDHQGGMHRILQRFPVDALWTSGDDGNNPDYHLLLREARAARVATPVPERRQLGEVTLEPLGPFASLRGPTGIEERIGPSAGVSVNDASLVVRAWYASRSVLFTGDIEADGEGELCGRASVGQVVASDILKVPHHGSRTSSSDELLDAVRPSLAVMSLGWRNRFRFPRPEVVDRYRTRGIRLLRTDLHGAITLTIAPDGTMSTSCARGCADGNMEKQSARRDSLRSK